MYILLYESYAHFVAHNAYVCWYGVMMRSPADLIKYARQYLTAGLHFRMVFLQDTRNNVEHFYRSVHWQHEHTISETQSSVNIS